MTDSDPIYRPQHAATYLGVDRSTLYRWTAEGRLSTALRIGPRAVGWRKSTLDALLAQQRGGDA